MHIFFGKTTAVINYNEFKELKMKQWLSIYCLCIFFSNALLTLAHAHDSQNIPVSETRNYLAQNNILSIAELPKGNVKREEYKKNLLHLVDNHYTDYVMFAIHYTDDPKYTKKLDDVLISYEKFLADIKIALKTYAQASFNNKEENIFSSKRSFPEAQLFLQSLKTTDANKYKNAIEISFQYLAAEIEIEDRYVVSQSQKSDKLDCDEKTIILQKLATITEIPQGNYIHIDSHVSLKLNVFPLVLDTYDMKIKSITEFAQQTIFTDSTIGSHFWRDSENFSLAEYATSNSYPKKIVNYKKITTNPYLVTKQDSLSGLMLQLAQETFIVSKKINLLEFILEFNPTYAEADNSYGNLLQKQGDVRDKPIAKDHYEKALASNPYYAQVQDNYAHVLADMGNTQKAKEHYEKALLLNPNYALAHYNYACLLYDLENYKEARIHLEIYNQLGKNRNDDLYKKFDIKLKSKGF